MLVKEINKEKFIVAYTILNAHTFLELWGKNCICIYYMIIHSPEILAKRIILSTLIVITYLH